MSWVHLAYALPLLGAAACAVVLALIVPRRSVPGAAAFVWMLASVAEWCALSALGLLVTNPLAASIVDKLQQIGTVSLPLAWLAFAITYLRHRLTRRVFALLCLEPLVTLLLGWTDGLHGLMWQRASVVVGDPLASADAGHGAWFWVNVCYSYATVLFGAGLLAWTLTRQRRLYRKQAAALLTALVAPLVGNFGYNLRLWPFPHLDPTPFAFLVACLVLAWGFFRYRLLDVVPIALDAVFAGLADPVFVLDTASRIVNVNPAGEALAGAPAARLLGASPAQVLDLPVATLEHAADGSDSRADFDRTRGGEARRYEVQHSPLTYGGGIPAGSLLVLHDVTDRTRIEAQLRDAAAALEHLALHDALTGLANRALFNERLETELAKVSRDGTRAALLLIDLDGFKLINDTLGHQAGDALLRAIASRLQQAAHDDTVARLGGDEFAILVPNASDDLAMRLAEVVQTVLGEPVAVESGPVSVGASIGVALAPRDGDRPGELVRAADLAMYAAKHAGGGVRFADPQTAHLRRAA